MKILFIGNGDFGAYYLYPNNITSSEEFVQFLNDNRQKFVSAVQLQTENCCAPYFIEEDSCTAYLNVAAITEIHEEEATVLPRAEYERRLAEIVASKCVNCANYTEELDGDNLEGHRNRMRLDGHCWGFRKKTD